MGRPNGALNETPGPADWPAWVLGFGNGGYFPNDPVRQAARSAEFRQWQKDRDAWFIEHGITLSLRVCNEEHRRRDGLARSAP
jgi:hypothetical protein